MTRSVALLRAVNLGSRNRVSMPALRELLADRGHRDVLTLVQSGNVVLTSTVSGERLRKRLEREVLEGLGTQIDVIVRSAAEMQDVVAGNPFQDLAGDPKQPHVTFLSAAPTAEAARELAQADLKPDRLVVRGREIYVWRPGGTQGSPASRLLGRPRLGLHGTDRNWNTVSQLEEMVRA